MLSSGYVSAVASETLKPKGLLLMAPAIGLLGYADQNPEPCADLSAIAHGWQDDVVAPQLVYEWAARHQLILQLVNDDHSLHQSIDCVAQHLVRMINHNNL
jgi:alpha/beta superfamily hydrolase